MATMSMTTTARGTSSYNPPLTQNTAPVHEYRCMFSRDMHKKKKTFHDGTLKFHTFNSRVMVYDLDRRFVGDLHYRDDEAFAEGLELRLDRGVLVQVEDELGETQTDLEQVLNPKNKDDDAGKHSSPTVSRPLRFTAAAAQQKPRSLKDVLGASQSQRGRAKIPYQSPYEQRQALANVQPAEPTAKRQKLMPTGKENAPVASTKKLAAKATLGPPLKRRAPSPRPMPSKDAAMDFQEVLDLSSDGKIQRPAKFRLLHSRPVQASPKVSRTQQEKAQLPSLASPRTLDGASSRMPARSPTNGSSGIERSRPKFNKRDRLQQNEPRRSTPTPDAIRSQLVASSGPNQVRLSMKPQQTRPKLMYRALLPPSMLPPKSPTAPPRGSPCDAVEDQVLPVPPPDRNLPKQQSLGQLLDQLDEEDYTSPPNNIGQQHQLDDVSVPPEELTGSLLSVSPAEKPDEPARSPQSIQDDLDEVGFAEFDPEQSLNLEDEPLSDAEMVDHPKLRPFRNASEKASTHCSPPATNVTGEVTQDRLEAELSAMNVKMMPPPPLVPPPSTVTRTAPSPRERPFRRDLSENDASFTQEVADEDFLGLTTQVVARKQRVVMGASPSKLRRTASDSAAIGTENDLSAEEMAHLPEKSESGPWTSMEAFLLFEWWPRGKNKPDFGQRTVTELDSSQYGAGFPGITTARDVLRDDANVL